MNTFCLMNTWILLKPKLRKQHYLLIDLTNNNIPQILSRKEFIALQNLSKHKDLIIQKSDKCNSAVIVQRQDYLKKMNDVLSDQKKFSKVSLKDDTLLNFDISQEKHVDKVLKKLVQRKGMMEKTRKSLKPVGTRPGVMPVHLRYIKLV